MEFLKKAWQRVVSALTSAPVYVLLLGLAACASLGAWSLQGSAAADLLQAKEFQQREVPNSDASPPSPEQNRRIIASLDQGIDVRRQIDEQLRSIESSVISLSERQTEARDVTQLALKEIERIAEALGGADRSATAAVGRLDTLRDRLRSSARIARLIARELAELDRKMGPSVGRP
jgi:hypothetical protein